MTELQAGAIIFISWHFGLIELGAEVFAYNQHVFGFQMAFFLWETFCVLP